MDRTSQSSQMEKKKYSNLCIMLCLAIASVAMAPLIHGGIAGGPKQVVEFLQSVSRARQKLTKLRFYVHIEHYGRSPKPNTAVVAQPTITANSPTGFGNIITMDAPFTAGPESFSKHLGYAQGFHANDNLEAAGNMLATNFIFTRGKYNGSCISILGHNPVTEQYREMPILGGTGMFRLAHGAVIIQTLYDNRAAGNTTIEVDIVALHY